MREQIYQKIYSDIAEMRQRNEDAISKLKDRVTLDKYSHLVRESNVGKVWTDALQTALNEHEIVEIPASEKVYYIDGTVIIPSNRRIEAMGATIRLTPDCLVLMLRNENTQDGTHAPISSIKRDKNISICGGSWEESFTSRKGYGRSGRYYPTDSEKTDFYGVSTCMLFNNMDALTLSDMSFSHTAGFAVQIGDMRDGLFENIGFTCCFADGLHMNGNCENMYFKNIYGDVGDDLVALNTYDWQNSSVNFGPARTVICEDISLDEISKCKATRLQPGVYTYDDGSEVDCALYDVIMKNVSGIYEYKMYLQTPPYEIGKMPEKGDVGTIDNLFLEGLEVKIDSQFNGIEINSNVGYMFCKDIRLIHDESTAKKPTLFRIGPKTWLKKGYEIFDPYLSSVVDTIELENITVNGIRVTDESEKLVELISFDDIHNDGHSTGSGTLRHIILDGKQYF